MNRRPKLRRSYPAEYMDSVEPLLVACYAGFGIVEIPASMRARQGPFHQTVTAR